MKKKIDSESYLKDSSNSFNYKPIRLNKIISNSGICSRRDADQFIKLGMVNVNGKIILVYGMKGHKMLTVDEAQAAKKVMNDVIIKRKDATRGRSGGILFGQNGMSLEDVLKEIRKAAPKKKRAPKKKTPPKKKTRNMKKAAPTRSKKAAPKSMCPIGTRVSLSRAAKK